MNTFGNLLRLTTFGESHGSALGGVLDGMPAGIEIDFDDVQHELDRRRPGQSSIVTSRNEHDKVEFLSGFFNGVTTGTPIGFIIRNSNQHSADYAEIEHTFRPSHADYTYTQKYGLRDYRGGGRSSARETVSRVVGGALAKQALKLRGVSLYAYTSRVGDIALPADFNLTIENVDAIDANAVRCPHEPTARQMEELIKKVKAEGDTVGGYVTCVITGVRPGAGEPVFGKLQATLAEAMMSINAAKGFEYGMGFDGCCRRGSEMIDEFYSDINREIHTRTNNSGGIQGGISNGEAIYFKVAFKPVATLLRDVNTVNDKGEAIVLRAKGRHDPCVLPRAVPVVEAMAALTILDCLIQHDARAKFL